jgi:putative addiction module component (TIGR02574 family)
MSPSAADFHRAPPQTQSNNLPDWRGNEEREIMPTMSKPALNVNQLTPEERLELIEELWESLRVQEDRVPLTNAQRAELDRRLDDLETSGDLGIPWEEVIRQIRSRAK